MAKIVAMVTNVNVGEKVKKASESGWTDWQNALKALQQEEQDGGRGMTASEELIAKLKKFEGLRLEAYLDAAGVPTIGYGHTGRDVKMGDRISKYWAEDLLRRDIRVAEAAVNELGVATTQGQFDALVSFVFNLGAERLKNSTLLRRIREGESRKAITQEWMRWVYADGKKLKGLEKRRAWEARKYFEL